MTRILIVDDKEENLSYLRALLTSEDCSVEDAHNGAEALAKARLSPPHIVISDLLMPVMDGYTLLRHWKRDGRLKRVPFIIYTATYTDAEDERLALSLGADAFLLKPAEPEHLLTRIGAVMANAVSPSPVEPRTPAEDEKDQLKLYSEVLVRKLEEKTRQLEESNRALLRDVVAREKAELAQRRMAETQMGILNALPAHIALLDPQGAIVAVNEAWRRFATASVLQSPDFLVGQNYIGACESAHGECADEARAVASGIRKVLGGEAQDFAIEYPCHSPTEQRWFRLMVTPLSETQRTGVVVMHINVTERRAAEEILREKEREQRRLAEELTIETQRLHQSQAVANVGSWETDLATLAVTWTEETFRIFETSPEEFTPTHQGFLERIHPEDRQKVDDAFKRSLGQPGPFAIEHRLLFPDGRIKFVEERWRTFDDQSGKPVRAVGTCQDITRQVTALAALVQSEERFRRLYERVPDAIQLIDQQGVILDVNPATETLSGYPESELIGQNFLELPLLQGGDLSRAKENLVRNAEGRGTGPSEYAVHRKDGKVITVEFEGFPIRIGEQDLVLGVGRDITERRAAEELIQTRVRQQEAIAKISFEATQATALEPLFDFATRAVAAALGVELCKVLQLAPDGSHLRLVSGIGWQPGLIGVGTVGVDRESQAGFTLTSDGPIYVNDFAKETRFKAPPILKQHQVVSGLSVTIQLRNKPWGVLGAHSRTVRQFNGPDAGFMQTVATLLAVVIERLAVQHTLTESEARMRDAQRIAHLGNWEVDLATNKVNWSEEAFRIFGAETENFSPSYETFLALVHPNDLEAMRAAHEKAVSGNGPLEIEHRIIRGDGEIRFIRERGELIHDENGAPVALSGTVLDITDLRAAQSRAERMNALLTEAQRIADMGSWEMDLATGRLVWSEETCRLFGIQPEEFGGTFEAFTEFILPEDRASYGEIHARIAPAAPLLEAEYRIRRPDGAVRWLFERGMVTFDSAGKVTRRLGVVMDITGRRKNEEQLRLLETCVSRLNDIVLITEAEPIDDPGPRILYVNDAFVKRTGFTREEAIGKTPRLLQGPKTQRDALDRIRAALKAWKPVREELINYTKSGEEFWLELEIVPVADATGWFTHWVSIERDITERKRAEDQLRMLSQAVEQSPAATIVTDLAGIIEYVNPKFTECTGYTAEEVIGKNPRILNSGENPPELYREMWATITAGKTWRGEMHNRKKNGETYWELASISPVLNSTGKATHYLGIKEDITERRKNEEQLRLLETCVSRLNDIVLITEAEPIDDPGPRILYVNDAFVRRTGFSREEAIGKTPRLLQGPKTQRDALDRIRAALKAWKPVREELINYTKSGEEFWLELEIVPVADATGWFTHWVSIERDITERKQAEEQLRQREQLLRIAGEVARMGGWSVDFPEVRITWSEEVCAIHDMPAGTVPTLEQGLSFYTPESRPVIESAFSLCASEGTPFDVELEVLTAKGRRIWVRSIGQAERDKAGTVLRVQGAFQDISEQKAAELEITRTNRALKLLSACNEALIHAVDEDDLLKVICEIAVDSGGYRMAWVGYAQEDAKRIIKPVAHAGEEAGYLSEVTITWEENTLEGSGPAGRTIRTGLPNISEDMEQDAGFHWRDVARQRGYRSVICLPLRSGNRTFGLLGLYSPEVLQVSAEEIKLLQELADDLAFGIGHLRARRESERIHNVVTRVATAVSASTGTEFFEQLAHNLAEALGACAAFVSEFPTGEPIAAHTVGAVVDGKVVENFEYLLEGTPCENLATCETFVVERQAAGQFPGAPRLGVLGAEAYVGKRLDHSTGRPLGHLCVIFREPLKHVQFVTSTMQIFAARAASELERRQTDAQLHEQAALLDAAHEAIQVKDMEGRITYWNKGAERTYGWTAAEVLGRKASDVLYADNVRFEEAFTSLLEREAWAGEMERRTKSGHNITVESRWTLVRDDQGRPKAILTIATDISERRRAEKELAQARENMLLELERLVAERTQSLHAATQEAERANRAKSEFLSRMSHELRTPLHAILGFAQILEMDAQNADDVESVAQIVRAGNHLLGLINEVLDIARVESGSLAYTPEPVSLRATLEEAISLLQPQASERRVQLAAVTGDADCEVLSSEQRFKQVVINLLSNAVKFNRKGGSVTVSCAKLEDRVRIKITDTGSGISAENVKKLFVPFERLDVGDRVIEGTGLGLSLSKHLVEAMGGRIGVESTPGQGSTFWLELPRIERTTAATELSLGGPERGDAEPPRPTAPRTVLYIEDNLSNSRLVQRILARRPEVKLISAMQGSLGLELARQHHPDLVLLDLHLPDIQGDEILRQLRADPHTAQLPIVIISADATATQIARLQGLGATDYLTKPIDVRKFLALVDAIEPRPPTG